MAKMAKDIAAGCVLVTAVYAIVVGYMLFVRKLKIIDLSDALLKIRGSPWHITFVALVLVLTAVVVMKLTLHKGTPFRGGMPSGHSAFGFSVFTITAFLTNNAIVITLVFLVALLLAISRVRKGLHTAWEVIAGSLVGILVTVLIFQLLYRL
jgi:diacylglycerol kinase (ATP)